MPNVTKRRINPVEFYKAHDRNKKRCFCCGRKENVIKKEIIKFGFKTFTYICDKCIKEIIENNGTKDAKDV